MHFLLLLKCLLLNPWCFAFEKISVEDLTFVYYAAGISEAKNLADK